MEAQKSTYKVILIGGGLAGLTSAIHLSMLNIEVLIIEKNNYPKHKVCGEYISNEVLPYLKSLGFNPFDFGAKRIDDFELTTSANKSIKLKLPLGGFGISRYELDFQLFKLAQRKGVEVVHDAVIDVSFNSNLFTVKTKNGQTFHSEIVIGSYGKRANLDISLGRPFIKESSPYLAVKTHVITDFPANKVALHNFKGGYCGVSMVEGNITNLCYITNYKSFKKFKNIKEFQEKVVFQNSALHTIFQNSVSQFDQPLSISQISFKIKNPVENHIIMCGDTAGMIHPLCGNGMAMAIRSAQLASESIIDYLHKKIPNRNEMEQHYANQWNTTFKSRLKTGRTIAYLFRQEWLAPIVLNLLYLFPSLISKIIKRTHGAPMKGVK